jgi:hypothetical protein
MLKVLDIWTKSQTFTPACLSRLQAIVDSSNPLNSTTQDQATPQNRTTTPTNSPPKAKNESDAQQITRATPNTGDYCFSFLFLILPSCRGYTLGATLWCIHHNAWRVRYTVETALWISTDFATFLLSQNAFEYIGSTYDHWERHETGGSWKKLPRGSISETKRLVYSVATMLRYTFLFLFSHCCLLQNDRSLLPLRTKVIKKPARGPLEREVNANALILFSRKEGWCNISSYYETSTHVWSTSNKGVTSSEKTHAQKLDEEVGLDLVENDNGHRAKTRATSNNKTGDETAEGRG